MKALNALLLILIIIALVSAYNTSNKMDYSMGLIKKCCDFGKILRSSKCITRNGTLNSSSQENAFYSSKIFGGRQNILVRQFKIIHELLDCKHFNNNLMAKAKTDSNIEWHENGSLYVEIGFEKWQWYDPDRYCLDYFEISTNETSADLMASICYTSEPEPYYVPNSICMLISCFFIILTLAVYACLPDLRNLHGLVLMAYLSSLFVAFSFLAFIQILMLYERKEINRELCLAFTFIIYFSLLAAFFWLNVMCFDIWQTFSGKEPLTNQDTARLRRFWRYCVYAFGAPTTLTILLAILEFSIFNETCEWLPRIRKQGCFLYGQSKFVYLYMPMVLLCVMNLIFFILTAMKIHAIKRETQILNIQEKQRFTLYIKLFILMGINWILEVVSSFTDENNIVWKFTDAYNSLVGLIIFVIFVCKKKIWLKIKDRYQSMGLQPTAMRSSSIPTQTYKVSWSLQARISSELSR